ncbi:hypothetical protein C0W35_21820 [Photobacterium kishitanii]|uniref:hypothetical protein n=1 Tax=Photobacterium kishitanii TaxID=318456 RepID=UPI000D15DA67|nr:hypothetical protein [Photobacterium kishitanii]PSU87157.1 hypothetical protein C0W35_21820 [Photobacterium kishitanii]
MIKFLLICSTLFFVKKTLAEIYIKESGDNLIINGEVFKNIFRDYQNDYVYLDKWEGKDAIIRESESKNKEKAIMTKKIDCIYQSFNTYYTNIRIGRSVCGANLSINNFEEYEDIINKYEINEQSFGNPFYIIPNISVSRNAMTYSLSIGDKVIPYNDLFFMFEQDGGVKFITVDYENKISKIGLQ